MTFHRNQQTQEATNNNNGQSMMRSRRRTSLPKTVVEMNDITVKNYFNDLVSLPNFYLSGHQ